MWRSGQESSNWNHLSSQKSLSAWSWRLWSWIGGESTSNQISIQHQLVWKDDCYQWLGFGISHKWIKGAIWGWEWRPHRPWLLLKGDYLKPKRFFGSESDQGEGIIMVMITLDQRRFCIFCVDCISPEWCRPPLSCPGCCPATGRTYCRIAARLAPSLVLITMMKIILSLTMTMIRPFVSKGIMEQSPGRLAEHLYTAPPCHKE